MNRRRFLTLTAVGAASVSLPALGMRAEPRGPWRAYAIPESHALLGGVRGMRDIGEAYRRAYPTEATAGALVAAIESDGEAAQASAGTVPALMHARVRADFDHGRTVVVRGWVLSVTEARQCALHSLLSA
jgi:hypothetical protein